MQSAFKLVVIHFYENYFYKYRLKCILCVCTFVDSGRWSVLDSGLTPEDGHGSPDLDEGHLVVEVADDLLRLHVVGHLPLFVDAPSVVPSASSEPTPPRDQRQHKSLQNTTTV